VYLDQVGPSRHSSHLVRSFLSSQALRLVCIFRDTSTLGWVIINNRQRFEASNSCGPWARLFNSARIEVRAGVLFFPLPSVLSVPRPA